MSVWRRVIMIHLTLGHQRTRTRKFRKYGWLVIRSRLRAGCRISKGAIYFARLLIKLCGPIAKVTDWRGRAAKNLDWMEAVNEGVFSFVFETGPTAINLCAGDMVLAATWKNWPITEKIDEITARWRWNFTIEGFARAPEAGWRNRVRRSITATGDFLAGIQWFTKEKNVPDMVRCVNASDWRVVLSDRFMLTGTLNASGAGKIEPPIPVNSILLNGETIFRQTHRFERARPYRFFLSKIWSARKNLPNGLAEESKTFASATVSAWLCGCAQCPSRLDYLAAPNGGNHQDCHGQLCPSMNISNALIIWTVFRSHESAACAADDFSSADPIYCNPPGKHTGFYRGHIIRMS